MDDIYPMSEYEAPQADAWFWQAPNRWVAVVAAHERDTWWEGADPADIERRPDPWEYRIDKLPLAGVLVYRNSDGKELTELAYIDKVAKAIEDAGTDDMSMAYVQEFTVAVSGEPVARMVWRGDLDGFYKDGINPNDEY